MNSLTFVEGMIPKIQSGDLTQARRVMDPQPILVGGRTWEWPRVTEPKVADKPWVKSDASWGEGIKDVSLSMARFCPHGQPGDRLWVRETWRCEERESDGMDGVRFRARDVFVPIANTAKAAEQWMAAHNNGEHGDEWRSPDSMPEWAARIWLELIRVRVVRLQSIDSNGAVLEGISATKFWQPDEVDENPKPIHKWAEPYWDDNYFFNHYPRHAYPKLWDSLNVKDGHRWADNPWVWVLELKLIDKPS